MQKYLTIFNISLAEYFVYRLNFILWRLRNVLYIITNYFLWTNIFTNNKAIFGYTQKEMITYILLVSITNAVVLSAGGTGSLGVDILSGKVIDQLLKPISFFQYLLTREAADKFLNIVFSFVETALLIIIFKPDVVIPTDITHYFFFFLTLIPAGIIAFFISISLSSLAFWTPEVWAPKFVFFILLTFLSGLFFPIDILPPLLYNVLLLTPFPYLLFLPTKLFITGLTPNFILPVFLSYAWCIGMYFVTKTLWHKGIKEFSFFGR